MRQGDVQNIYRIINVDKDDLDLTRAQALHLYRQLAHVLFPPPSWVTRRTKRPTLVKRRRSTRKAG